MEEVFSVNLELTGYDIEKAFLRLKELQKKDSVFDDYTTISIPFPNVKLTAGVYDSYEEFADIIEAIIKRNKERIKNHVMNVFPKYNGCDALGTAVSNILRSSEMQRLSFTDEEEEMLFNCYKKSNTK